MSRLIARAGVVLVALSFFVAAPAAQAETVRAVVKFAPTVSAPDRAAAISAAGGRIERVRADAILAWMTAVSADQLRTAMGVISVKIRRS
jgi:hypothetical protein